MNSVNLTGRLSKDLELKETTNKEHKYLYFTVAVDRGLSKEKREDKNVKTADFINCVAWDSTAEYLEKYAKKGNRVEVSGKLQDRSYEAQDGTKRYLVEVIANKVSILETKPKESVPEPTYDGYESGQATKETTAEENPYEVFGNTVNLDEVTLNSDDLPF